MPAAPAPLPGLDPQQPVEGRPRVACRLCGRPLRGSDARRWGLGEGCRAKLQVRAVRRRGRWDVQQETLPGT